MTEIRLTERMERWPIERLIPYARNPRTHSEDQVGQIAASIREFGFTNPVLVDTEGGIVAGHGRVMAAKRLGLAEIPVVVLDHLTETQRRAYVIADNRLALNAGWDERLLALEFQDLKLEGFDLDLTGFAGREVERLLEAEFGEGDESKDEAPSPPADPISRLGDLWTMGPHRLLCGDATDPKAMEIVLGGGLADMTFTDPPYNIDYRGSASDRKAGRTRTILNDALGEGFGAFLGASCRNILAATKGAAYICMASAELHTLRQAFIEAGGHWSGYIVWAKNAFTLGRADYQHQFETILYGWREGTDHYWCGARDQGDVWEFDRPVKNDLHPTMKPVGLIERAIRNSSKTRDTVLDPFGGSGSTLIACESTERQARLIELDPRYVDVSIERWQARTGRAAIRQADGQTFDELREERQRHG